MYPCLSYSIISCHVCFWALLPFYDGLLFVLYRIELLEFLYHLLDSQCQFYHILKVTKLIEHCGSQHHLHLLHSVIQLVCVFSLGVDVSMPCEILLKIKTKFLNVTFLDTFSICSRKNGGKWCLCFNTSILHTLDTAYAEN